MTYLVGISGGTGSGKGTIAKLIHKHLDLWGLSSFVLSTDDCYRDLSYMSSQERDQLCFNPEFNFDHPKAVDFDRLIAYCNRFKTGEQFKFPKYDFSIHSYGNKTKNVPSSLDVAIIEGIYALYSGSEVEDKLITLYDHKIFVATTPEIAQNRRIRRDTAEESFGGRGRDLEHVLKQLDSTVIPMQKKFVYPTQINADDLVDWRVNESDNINEIKQMLINIARQRALRIYEEVKKPIMETLDPDEVNIYGIK